MSPLPAIVTASQVGLPAMLTYSLFKQIADLMYVKSSIGGFFFDAVFRTEHSLHTVITSHPVQNGANISDHAYLEPARVTMEIGMSDVGSSTIFGQFMANSSKSKAAFEALLKMREKRLPVDISTRLKSYKNMMIEDLSFPDDINTFYGLRATVSMRQVIIAEVAKVSKVSQRPNVSESTQAGKVVPVSSIPETSAYKLEQLVRGR